MSIRTIFNYFLVASLAAVIVFLILIFAPSTRLERAKIKACQENTSAQCLTDLGVEFAITSRVLPGYLREVEMLAQMGRMDDAFALEFRVLSEKERRPDDVEAAVNRSLASHRITAAIRNGETLQTAISKTPSVDPGVLWISALDLLGRNPYGATMEPRRAPDERMRLVVSEMAETIVRMAQDEAENSRPTHLGYAAKLYAALGNRVRATQLLEALQQSGDPLGDPSEELMQLIGAENAVRLCSQADGIAPTILLTAASVETDEAQTTDYLQRAFSGFASKDNFPDLEGMERTVDHAAGLGLKELAQQLARELARQAQTGPSALPVFPHLYATRALMAAGASEIEIRESLTRAENAFPRNDQEIVGIGLVSGPIIWGSFGLDAQARRETANLRARLGDIEEAIQLMDGIPNPEFAWNDMLTPDIPLEYLNDLLDAASTEISNEDHAYVRAQLARDMLLGGGAEGGTENQRLWARRTTAGILQAEPLDGNRAVITYTVLARVGRELGDPDLADLALTRMAQAALKTQDYGDLIRAGFEWFRADQTH